MWKESHTETQQHLRYPSPCRCQPSSMRNNSGHYPGSENSEKFSTENEKTDQSSAAAGLAAAYGSPAGTMNASQYRYHSPQDNPILHSQGTPMHMDQQATVEVIPQRQALLPQRAQFFHQVQDFHRLEFARQQTMQPYWLWMQEHARGGQEERRQWAQSLHQLQEFHQLEFARQQKLQEKQFGKHLYLRQQEQARVAREEQWQRVHCLHQLQESHQLELAGQPLLQEERFENQLCLRQQEQARVAQEEQRRRQKLAAARDAIGIRQHSRKEHSAANSFHRRQNQPLSVPDPDAHRDQKDVLPTEEALEVEGQCERQPEPQQVLSEEKPETLATALRAYHIREDIEDDDEPVATTVPAQEQKHPTLVASNFATAERTPTKKWKRLRTSERTRKTAPLGDACCALGLVPDTRSCGSAQQLADEACISDRKDEDGDSAPTAMNLCVSNNEILDGGNRCTDLVGQPLVWPQHVHLTRSVNNNPDTSECSGLVFI